MLRKLKNWLFGDSFTDGMEFAADNSEQEIERCIEYARHFNEYGDFERGMEYHLQHRKKFPEQSPNA